MADRIRGQETVANVVVDGALQLGSFTVMEGFKVTPLTDIVNSSFLGESEDEYDLQHHGFELAFSVQESDNAVVENVLLPLVNKLAAGDTLPNVNLIFIKRYRGTGAVIKTMTFKNVKLKLDGQDAGDRKSYVKNSFTGRCREMVNF